MLACEQDNKVNFILIVAKPGVEAMSLELATQSPVQNKVPMKLLQLILQEKKKRTVERKSSLIRSLQEYQATLEANNDFRELTNRKQRIVITYVSIFSASVISQTSIRSDRNCGCSSFVDTLSFWN